jgi:hypothetical protein
MVKFILANFPKKEITLHQVELIAMYWLDSLGFRKRKGKKFKAYIFVNQGIELIKERSPKLHSS